MEVDCAGCAGCCIDWRPLAADPSEHERRGDQPPLDNRYNLVPLTRDDVKAFVDAGYTDVMRPRLWRAAGERPHVTIDGFDVVAIGERPLFMLGLRHVPKPVGPFDADPRWLSACVFLDPTTLQCRIHDEAIYPRTCATYPGHHLVLDREPECVRVERETGRQRLLDETPPADVPPPPLGAQSLGATVFLHPSADRLAAVIDRLARDELTADDRREFVAVALAQSPGMPAVNEERYRSALARLGDATSWVSPAGADWRAAASNRSPEPGLAATFEEARGAPHTQGWPDDPE